MGHGNNVNSGPERQEVWRESDGQLGLEIQIQHSEIFQLCVSLLCLSQLLKRSHWKGNNIYFGLQLQRFSPWPLGLIAVGLWWNKAAHLIVTRKQRPGIRELSKPSPQLPTSSNQVYALHPKCHYVMNPLMDESVCYNHALMIQSLLDDWIHQLGTKS